MLDEASIHNGTALTSGTALSEVAVFSQQAAAGKLKPFIAIAAGKSHLLSSIGHFVKVIDCSFLEESSVTLQTPSLTRKKQYYYL